MRIYEDLNATTGLPTGMVNVDDDLGNPLFSEPKGTLTVLVSANRVQVYSRPRGQALTDFLAVGDVKDSTGTAYSGTLSGTRAALNRFFFDINADISDLTGFNGFYMNGQKNNAGIYSTATIAANNLSAFPLQLGGIVKGFAFQIINPLAGNVVVGLYAADASNAPAQKIWQSSQETTIGNKTYAVNLNLPKGLYFVMVHCSNTGRFLGFTADVAYNLLGLNLLGGGTRDFNRLELVQAYNATLPAVAPVMNLLGGGFAPPALFFKKV